jgi:hypothetical protein
LLLAAGLGLAGAVCNWLYLDSLAQSEARLAFIGVKPDVRLNIGDVFKTDMFEPVEIPRSRVGNLQDVAPLWSALDAIIGLRANKAYAGGEIVLRQDLTTPAQEELASLLAVDEVARWVPIDSRSVSTDQINPGDLVSFEAPKEDDAVVANQVLSPTATAPPVAPVKTASTELIGPFRVLAVGSRRERPNIQQARGRSGGAESTITIAVQLQNGAIEPRAAKLFEAVRTVGSQGLSVLLHSAKTN